MKRSSLEFKVGVFVFVGLALLVTLAVKAGDFYLKPGYTVKFLFDFVSGIEKGSQIRLVGVNVGEVKSVQVVRDPDGRTHVAIEAWIAQGAYIEEDAEIRINSLGLLGEKYVEILPGTQGSKTLTNGASLSGRSPIQFEKITESGNDLINKIENTVDSINDVVSDPKFRADVRQTFGNSAIVTKNLIQVSEDLKDAAQSAKIVLGRLRDGEGTVGRLMKDDTIARDLEAFVKDVKAHPWKLLKKN